MVRSRNAAALAALAVAVLGATVGPVLADADKGDKAIHKVHVKKLVHDCEGEDCDHDRQVHRVIIVGEDGETREIEGDTLDWVGRGHDFALGHHGKGGFLGVATTELTPELRRHFGVPEAAGVLVARVVDDSAAALAGVEVGDILTTVAGETISSTRELMRAIGRHEPGAALDLELWRDGTLETASATLGERQRRGRRAMVLRCAEGYEDCPQIAALEGFDCGDESECDVTIECRDGACDCVVNGEGVDCDSLPGFEPPGE